MYLLQSLIIGAVMVHKEYYHWTPNRNLREEYYEHHK
jgi:hypothetical protein